MPAARISVLVTCHDLGAYVDEAVQSVLAQTVPDAEILVVDDGSTDPATVSVLESARWPRTTVFHTANQGLAKARNFLLARAAGTYVCALDADDRLHPRYFEKALATFRADPDLAFVASWLRMFGAEERVWQQQHCDLPTLLAEDTVMTAALVRRDLVQALGGYDEQMPAPGDEDWDLWIRVVASGGRGTILQEVLFDYRRRPGSMGERCVARETHLELLGYLMRKHGPLFEAHWRQIARRKDVDIARALDTNQRVERDIAERVLPDIQRLEREAARLRAKLSGGAPPGRLPSPSDTHEALRRQLTNLEGELAAIRRSWSWRLTAPLRALGGRFRS